MLVLLRCLLCQLSPHVDKARRAHVPRRWVHRKLSLTLKLFKQWKTRTTTTALPAAEVQNNDKEIHNQARWPNQSPRRQSTPSLQFLWEMPKRPDKAPLQHHELLMMIRVQINGRLLVLLVIQRKNLSQQISCSIWEKLKHQRTWSRRTCRGRLILIQVKLL